MGGTQDYFDSLVDYGEKDGEETVFDIAFGQNNKGIFRELFKGFRDSEQNDIDAINTLMWIIEASPSGSDRSAYVDFMRSSFGDVGDCSYDNFFESLQKSVNDVEDFLAEDVLAPALVLTDISQPLSAPNFIHQV